MASTPENEPLLISSEEEMEKIRRRVQHKIAEKYLEVLDPDAMIPESQREVPDHSKLSTHFDEETREEFEERFGKYRKKKGSKYSLQNVLWFVGSIAIFYYTDFYIACRYDPRVNRNWFNIGAILIVINVCIALFFIVWLSAIKKVDVDDWEKRYPILIPIATGAFIMGGMCVTVGLWPVWSIFTPVILFTLFMGFVVFIAMIP
ncbi:transmembrane protein 128-like [Pecten maximus]|uniref:transmembrane protein 128-like n=1 Tax=Pecten maximus TaxID=6579 RepID=UPI001458C4AB|nr:transmembrane protein 128-like [Pecten maximus]